MYRIRKGRVVEASLIGAVGVAGGDCRRQLDSGLGAGAVLLAEQGTRLSSPCAATASSPRCCRCGCCCVRAIICRASSRSAPSPCSSSACSSPTRRCRARWSTTSSRTAGRRFPGSIFPFVFICIMCGAISGFHALVSSGTTPKMIDKETHVRPIGYGAMLMEGLVGVVALIAAASHASRTLLRHQRRSRQGGRSFSRSSRRCTRNWASRGTRQAMPRSASTA